MSVFVLTRISSVVDYLAESIDTYSEIVGVFSTRQLAEDRILTLGGSIPCEVDYEIFETTLD